VSNEGFWEEVEESSINIISEGTRLEGKVSLDRQSRVHGVLVGEISSQPGSKLILAETAVVEGTLHADEVIIDGFVRGDIIALGKVTISRTGRVIGNVQTPSFQLEFGAYFEGKCKMEGQIPVLATRST
jgi:cytoskeletal protein CcmA (bactofilin family)